MNLHASNKSHHKTPQERVAVHIGTAVGTHWSSHYGVGGFIERVQSSVGREEKDECNYHHHYTILTSSTTTTAITINPTTTNITAINTTTYTIANLCWNSTDSVKSSLWTAKSNWMGASVSEKEPVEPLNGELAWTALLRGLLEVAWPLPPPGGLLVTLGPPGEERGDAVAAVLELLESGRITLEPWGRLLKMSSDEVLHRGEMEPCK